MANARGPRGIGDRTRSSNMIYEFVPSSGWTEDSNGHYLLVDLPDFKKEEVKLQVDYAGHITVSGERQGSQNKYSYFEQTFKVPENSDIDNISGKFDGEILHVTVPKRVVEAKEESEIENESVNYVSKEDLLGKLNNDENCKKDDDSEHECHTERKEKSKMISHVKGFSKESLGKWEHEAGFLRRAIKMFSKNKGIVITAVLAFSLGVLVSRKFESTEK